MDKLFPSKAHITLVISPLRSLMLDLVTRYKVMGIRCVAILKMSEMDDVDVSDIRTGKISLLLTEAILGNPWWGMVKSWGKRVCAVVVDEAHCVSTWGTEFRPKYKDTVSLLSICPFAALLALTATATQPMVDDILASFHTDTKETSIVAVLPDRPNIFLSMERVTGDIGTQFKWVIDSIMEQREKAPKYIIYARTIDRARDVYGVLMKKLQRHAWVNSDKTSKHRRLEMFHGSTDLETQKALICQFTSGTELKIIVATIAFGMGIDVKDVAHVIHWGPSKTILGYWQEVGRCGRDGRSAKATLYLPPRSLNSTVVSTDMIQLVEDVEKVRCMRKKILRHLFIQGMSQTDLDNCSTTNCCSVCSDLQK